MDLRDLECFVVICEEKNFTAAAERLYISQPAISKTLNKLEEELGLRLINRNQKPIALTAEGEVLVKLAREILAQFQAAQATMAEFKNLKRGSFTIAVPPMTGAYFFPPLFAGFKKKHPSLDMQIIDGGSFASLEAVRKEKINTGLIIFPLQEMVGVSSLPVTQQELVVCLPADHPLAGQPFLTLQQLETEPVVLYNEGFVLRSIILNSYAEAGLTPKIEISTNQFLTIKALVAKGAGISFLPAIAVNDTDAIVTVPLEPRIHVTIGLVWNSNGYLPPACKAFIDFVQEYCSTNQ
jgi:DNA-binding transcriptional LysR family regulator